MAQNIDVSFVQGFQTEVFTAFQRMGSQLRPMVRLKTRVREATTTMQKLGRGTATEKPRNGEVPLMNADRGTVTITLRDRYAREMVDKLDELKINHDERGVLVNTIVWALGRAMDQDIVNALDTATQFIDNGQPSVWTTVAGPLAAMEIMGANDVPLDNDAFAVVPWEAWGDLMSFQQFSSAEYVTDNIYQTMAPKKRWAGFTWMPFSGTTVSNGDKFCYFFHRSAVGAAIGADITTDITWNGEKQAHNIVGSMSMGAALIDQVGVRKKLYDL